MSRAKMPISAKPASEAREGEARAHAVCDHAREGAAHHQGNVEQYDQGRYLNGAGAELIGGAADESHEVRGGEAQNEQEVCKHKTARGSKERAQTETRMGRHGISKGLAARRTLPRLGADDASLLCELSPCDPCHEYLLG
jgi:hypothetical protein